MATTVITGRDVSFTIGGNTFDAQTTSATLSNEHTIEVFQTLDGRAYKALDDQWTFTVELLQDWGAAGSLFEIMWGVCESAPNTVISTVFTAASGATFTFNVLPVFPSAGGAAPGALTDTWTFTVVGQPGESFS